MSKKPFYVEGMTIEEIMALGDDVIRQLDTRDISRAVRTLSLAANKRLNRMLKHATPVIDTKTGNIERFVEHGNLGLDFNALYGYTSYIEKGKNAFGVKNITTPKTDRNYINSLKAEFSRVKSFLQAESTTIPGAIQLRQKKEIALFGETREAAMIRMLNEGAAAEDVTAMIENRNDLMTDVYETFHEWKEEYALQGSYSKDKGNQALRELGEAMKNGMTKDQAKETVSNGFESRYQSEQLARAERESKRYNRLRR